METGFSILRKVASVFFGMTGVAAFFILVSKLPASGSTPLNSDPMILLLGTLGVLTMIAGGILWINFTFGFDEAYAWSSIGYIVGAATYDLMAVVANSQIPFFHPEPAQSFVKIVFTIVFPLYAIADRFWISKNIK